MTYIDAWKLKLKQREAQSLYRRRQVLRSPQASVVDIALDRYINFSSNDYLGLANHPKLIESMQSAAQSYGVGSGASHLICGHSEEHHALEEELAAFTGRDRVLLFSTGYMANLGVISALLDKNDAVFHDRLNHASLLDAGILSGARFYRYLHNDLASLERRLEKSSALQKMVVSDAVFSMDGDLAQLSALSKLANKHQACLMVDDAHGFGVLGECGAGTAEYFSLNQSDVPIYMGTLGKALGSFGAFVAGSDTLIEMLVQFSRSYIYTTALPPAVAAASRMALRLLQEEAWRRETLLSNIAFFKDVAVSLNIPLLASQTAIQVVMIGSNSMTMQLHAKLKETGFLVGAIRPPTVPKDTARLRITLSAEHSQAQIYSLLTQLKKIWQTLSRSSQNKGEMYDGR